MQCSKCKFANVADDARYCPECGAKIQAGPQPTTEIKVDQEVGSVAGGKITGVEVGEADNVNIHITDDKPQTTTDTWLRTLKNNRVVAGIIIFTCALTVLIIFSHAWKIIWPDPVPNILSQIQIKLDQGEFVDKDKIVHAIVIVQKDKPGGVEDLLQGFMNILGVNKQVLLEPGAKPPPDNILRQISEVMAAQRQLADKGQKATPQSLYRLGMLAAYSRDYDQALKYFHQAATLDPQYTEAFKAIARLQQARAMDDYQGGNYAAAKEKLADAMEALRQTDPLDLEALNLRGYIAKTQAQLAEASHDRKNQRKYNEEAARLFRHIVQLDPRNAGAYNGLGNIEYALGNYGAAISAMQRATELDPSYTAAHHDLALAFEAKMQTDPGQAGVWRQKAIQEWKKTYKLAPDDPGFSTHDLEMIKNRILALERQK